MVLHALEDPSQEKPISLHLQPRHSSFPPPFSHFPSTYVVKFIHHIHTRLPSRKIKFSEPLRNIFRNVTPLLHAEVKRNLRLQIFDHLETIWRVVVPNLAKYPLFIGVTDDHGDFVVIPGLDDFQGVSRHESSLGVSLDDVAVAS